MQEDHPSQSHWTMCPHFTQVCVQILGRITVTNRTSLIASAVSRISTAKGDTKINPFITFMASSTCRVVRIVAGIVLIVLGLLGLQGTTGIIRGGHWRSAAARGSV